MSSQGYASPLRLEGDHLRPLRRLYLAFYTLTGVTLLWLPLPMPVQLLVFAVFSMIARRVWATRCELGGPPVRLVWDAAQCWWWTQSGRERSLELCGDSFLSTRLCILNFREPGKRGRYSVILLPGAVGRDRYRQLMVRFRITADPVATP